MSEPTDVIDAEMRAAVIDGVLSELHKRYIFPEVAQQMEEAIRRRTSNGEYDAITTAESLCAALTAHLQEVSHDKHLRLVYTAEPQPLDGAVEPSPAQVEEWRLTAALQNFGFEKVERLAGNVGYLDLRFFAPPEWGGETAAAAMTMLAHTDALIVDLRESRGGSPQMIALVSSYLFPGEPVHLNDLYWREGDWMQQFWTLPYVPGRRYGEKPVYVLTSRETFSGSEEFSNNLKVLKRATLIGETTGGGAHPVGGFPIAAHIAAHIPVGRAINPVTGTNWEGTGVIPDVDVPREDAFAVAYRAALTHVLEMIGDTPRGSLSGQREAAQHALADLDGREGPPRE
jgi:hypothetical protein